MYLCLETPKHFYIRGPLTLVKGLTILEFIDTFVLNLVRVSSFEKLYLELDSSGDTFHSSSRFHGF